MTSAACNNWSSANARSLGGRLRSHSTNSRFIRPTGYTLLTTASLPYKRSPATGTCSQFPQTLSDATTSLPARPRSDKTAAMKPNTLLLATLLITGCAATQTSHVLIGTARPAIKPDQVQIYIRPPSHYEEIALLHTDSQWDGKFTARGHSDAVIKRLQHEAAKLGANGILLENFGDQTIGTISSYGTGTSIGYSAPIGVKQGGGLAIYVSPSQPLGPASSSTHPDATN
jgi:hypothetical protein